MAEADEDRPSAGAWTVLDVRAVTSVATLDGRVITHECALCGVSFEAAAWSALSVARDRTGGAVVAMCTSCEREHWETLRERMTFVAEMLAAPVVRPE